MSTFKLLVFDWDGTLYDSIDHIVASLQQAACAVGVEAPQSDVAKSVIGLGLLESMAALFPNESKALHAEVAAYYKQFFARQSDASMQLFPNVRELLSSLHKRGFLLGVATGKGRRGLDYVLEREQLSDLFHATRCADETASKPHPKMLHEIMETMNVTPAETLMIGDSTYDMEMATRAKVERLAVTYGVQTSHNMLPYQPLAIVDDVRQLARWFETLADEI